MTASIGDNCILANGATLAGHVMVEEWATVGAFCPVHQFCRIGQACLHRRRDNHYAGCAAVFADLREARDTAYGLNKVGLERRGFSREQVRALQHAYRMLLASKLNTSQALELCAPKANAWKRCSICFALWRRASAA